MATKHMQMGETSCGPLCQHPGCWQSNTRQDKGFPRMMRRPVSPPDFDLDLPTVKPYNMLDDYGDDPGDKFPAKYGGKACHERSNVLPELQSPRRTQSIKATRAPQTSPKSSAVDAPGSKPNAFKVVEVQEVFDPEDLEGTWDDTFISKSYFVWVPNKKKKKRRAKKTTGSWHESGISMSKKGPQFVTSKDMTEAMVPKEIEQSRLTTRKTAHKQPAWKKKSRSRSPTNIYTMTPRTARQSTKMEFDHEGISELLDLPREILVQVLDNTRQSDLMSREKIREIIKKFMPPQVERGYTNVSLTSNDLLQQKKLPLHEGNKNVRQPELMETKPVFYLDEDVMDDDDAEDEDLQRSGSPYGSLKDLYLSGTYPRDLTRYKKPLPSIQGKGGRAVSAGDAATSKLPSISLGLPELPSGIRQTRAFTYKKNTDIDFTLAPVPTPPTSVRTTTPGSEHGTIRANVPSQASDRAGSSERGSQAQQEDRHSRGQPTPDQPLHAVSPTFSTGVPLAPATTPATTQPSMTRSAPLMRDQSGSLIPTVPNTPQDWPGSREKTGSPSLRAPVNTPGSMLQDQMGLGTIQEAAAPEEYSDQPIPVSRGRSVRFEIPEVPPPPSSPQLSDKDSIYDQKEPSRNTVTVNTTIPKETPSSGSKQPMSSYTIRSDANTVNTSMKEDGSFLQSGAPTREISMVSSPEPWPQVNEADYDVAPVQSPETSLHENQQTGDQQAKMREEGNRSRNALVEERAGDRGQTLGKGGQTPGRELNEEYVNKHIEQSSVVKKMMEDSRKTESPAPPPPSPEAKEDDEIKIINKPSSVVMTPVLEEEAGDSPGRHDDDDATITVLQIPPTGPAQPGKSSEHRQIDTFVNIDIPAAFDGPPQRRSGENVEIENHHTILEEPEPSPEPSPEESRGQRDVALSVQSTLANRTISEREDTEYTSSMIEPAMSQASQGPALSEDFSEKPDQGQLLGDWSGMIVGGDKGPDTMAMLSSDQPEMTEEGGDHEGFKEDLRQEYVRLQTEGEGEQGEREGQSSA